MAAAAPVLYNRIKQPPNGADGNFMIENAAAVQTGFLGKRIRVADQLFRYVVYLPSGYDGMQPLPVILFLHGPGEQGSDGWRQVSVGLGPAILADPARWPFAMLFPQLPADRPSNWMLFEAPLLAMLRTTLREYATDPRRVYLTGISMGGFGTWMLAAKHPDLFAAIVPICGGGDPDDAPALKTLPIWCFHGEADELLPADLTLAMVEALGAVGAHPRVTIYPDAGHNCWDRAYREKDLPDWLLSHTSETDAFKDPRWT